jgi:hypothetical protein
MRDGQTNAAARARAEIVADEARFEALLGEALRVPVPRAGTRPRRWPALAAIAASLVLAAGAWLGLRSAAPPGVAGPLAAEIVAHIHHEPAALVVTADRAPQAAVDAVLQRAGASFTAPVGQVSYAKLCPFRGRMVAHFVVQGERGPVTVLLLPDEQLAGPLPFREGEFSGTLVPIEGGGAVAVVGQPDEPLELIRERFVEVLRWRL